MFANISYNNFNKFRNKLLDYSRRFKIQFEDLEELVNDSILKAMEKFDSDRGNFESLCIVILKNKIFNFKRDNPYLYLLILLDEDEYVFKADRNSIEKEESFEMALKFLKELKSRLSEDEILLFNEIYEMCGNSGKISISKASKNIGIDPLKGWDIFRKIQRKANYRTHKITKDVLCLKRLPSEYEPLFSEMQIDYELNETQFSFSEDVINKLNSLYNF